MTADNPDSQTPEPQANVIGENAPWAIRKIVPLFGTLLCLISIILATELHLRLGYELFTEQGLAAMQSINVAVIRPSFLGTFFGTALLSLGSIVLAGLNSGESEAALLLAAGGVLYFVGTFLVTIVRNVPLNNVLESVNPTDANATEIWEDYLRRWTIWNHVRTAAALLATLGFALGAVRHAT